MKQNSRFSIASEYKVVVSQDVFEKNRLGLTEKELALQYHVTVKTIKNWLKFKYNKGQENEKNSDFFTD